MHDAAEFITYIQPLQNLTRSESSNCVMSVNIGDEVSMLENVQAVPSV